MNYLILVPVIFYLSLSFVRIGEKGKLRNALLVWGILGIVALCALNMIPLSVSYRENEALQALDKELDRLRKKPIERNEVVFLIQGSSASAACIKPRLLEKLLRDQKIQARVIMLFTAGSNQFERIELLRQFQKQLTREQLEALHRSKVILMREVLYAYEQNPLSGYAENAFGERSIAYSTHQNFTAILRTIWERARNPPTLDDQPGSLPVVAAQFLFNLFRVGTIRSVETDKIRYSHRGPGPVADLATKEPSLGIESIPQAERPDLRHSKHESYQDNITEFRAEMNDPARLKPILDFPWRKFYLQALLAESAGLVDVTVFFTTPHIGASPRNYEAHILRELLPNVVRFDGGSDTVLLLLNNARNWKDRVHLTPTGGEIYTNWLASQMVSAWPRLSAFGSQN